MVTPTSVCHMSFTVKINSHALIALGAARHNAELNISSNLHVPYSTYQVPTMIFVLLYNSFFPVSISYRLHFLLYTGLSGRLAASS